MGASSEGPDFLTQINRFREELRRVQQENARLKEELAETQEANQEMAEVLGDFLGPGAIVRETP